MDDILKKDQQRYSNKREFPSFQKYFRKLQSSNKKGKMWIVYKLLYKCYSQQNAIEIGENTSIGEGLYFGHPYCITINSKAVIGKNCNIHKGVTIGQENRGLRKGAPSIGNEVWIGVNSTIVGNIVIGDDVLIAANSFVNIDVPSHSIVYGNPCMIKSEPYATEGYINRKV